MEKIERFARHNNQLVTISSEDWSSTKDMKTCYDVKCNNQFNMEIADEIECEGIEKLTLISLRSDSKLKYFITKSDTDRVEFLRHNETETLIDCYQFQLVPRQLVTISFNPIKILSSDIFLES